MSDEDRVETLAELKALESLERDIIAQIQQIDNGVMSLVAGPSNIIPAPPSHSVVASQVVPSNNSSNSDHVTWKQSTTDQPQVGSSPTSKRPKRNQTDTSSQATFIPSSVSPAEDVQMDSNAVSYLVPHHHHMLIETHGNSLAVSVM